MPEIAEVRVVAKTLKKQILNKKITKVKVLYSNMIIGDSEEFAKKLINKSIKDINTYGKWLIFDLGDISLLSHLRMEGKYFFVPTEKEISKHEHVIISFENNMDLRYADVRKFGKMQLVNSPQVYETESLKKLGYEPDDKNLTAGYLFEKFRGKKLPIKTFLLDQTIINGLGNIYANEVLFAAKIHPERSTGDISLSECERIIQNSKRIITKSFEMGGTTIKSYTSSLGVIGEYQNELKVQSRENKPCLVCNTPIKRIKIAGRSTFFCEKCQK